MVPPLPPVAFMIVLALQKLIDAAPPFIVMGPGTAFMVIAELVGLLFGAVKVIGPEVAPVGTVEVILVDDTMVKVADILL